ncbi:hypothetical protein DICSQDRAFT_173545 [Dichomitus squalens LYAD-421 SS1]|uniref:Uncharacterized protein n=1 Tax=Dichomitus squalens (strain LYAD-421) TaxID=732165 RepID=R7SPF0_DICSQ|nr:uncharacterized protein DICSQDRAFT_173545 [Dichomitus squalens LYAD-421 SS1]EJF57793.1 hypothetical protein DICSQDRAFT_173545 [Dichomitus squalens LYAD-421 SS1]
MAVFILCRLSLVASITDFELEQPSHVPFKYIRYPDSFRMTITQLVDDGTSTFHFSSVNFDGINQHIAGVHPTIVRITKLLVLPKDNTPNFMVIKKYLPRLIDSLSDRINGCVRMAEEMAKEASTYLELVKEMNQSYLATQRKARRLVTEKEGARIANEARQAGTDGELPSAQEQPDDASNRMPSGGADRSMFQSILDALHHKPFEDIEHLISDSGFGYESGTSAQSVDLEARKKEVGDRGAQYSVANMKAELKSSRDDSEAAVARLKSANSKLGVMRANGATTNMGKMTPKRTVAALSHAIVSLTELRVFLDDVVMFFGRVHTFVETLRTEVNEFINEAGAESTTTELDTYAKGANMVNEDMSDMYVTLYDDSVHPGVKMLSGMGALTKSDDPEDIDRAGKNIQDWAQDARDRICNMMIQFPQPLLPQTCRADLPFVVTTLVRASALSANSPRAGQFMPHFFRSIAPLLQSGDPPLTYPSQPALTDDCSDEEPLTSESEPKSDVKREPSASPEAEAGLSGTAASGTAGQLGADLPPMEATAESAGEVTPLPSQWSPISLSSSFARPTDIAAQLAAYPKPAALRAPADLFMTPLIHGGGSSPTRSAPQFQVNFVKRSKHFASFSPPVSRIQTDSG